MGQAASQTHPGPLQTVALPRHGGGTLRSALQTAVIAGLFTSGLYLWLWPASGLVLWGHLIGGLALLALLAPWLIRHIPEGLAHSGRRSFRLSSWALLLATGVELVTGLALSLPALLWLSGRVWFPASEITAILSLLHLWAGWIIVPGLILHLAMRHWTWVRK